MINVSSFRPLLVAAALALSLVGAGTARANSCTLSRDYANYYAAVATSFVNAAYSSAKNPVARYYSALASQSLGSSKTEVAYGRLGQAMNYVIQSWSYLGVAHNHSAGTTQYYVDAAGGNEHYYYGYLGNWAAAVPKGCP